ncbi:MAG: FUSC family protein [Candidatus Acidiferrales bacterium]
MGKTRKSKWLRVSRQDLVHSARTGIAACVSLETARLCRLPEAYWATITTIVIMQSTLGAALTVSEYRFAGTGLGSLMGALLATYFPGSLIVFTLGVFVLGLICAMLRLDRAAYRFAGITLAIVMLVAHLGPAWIVAVHRSLEVSIGVGVGLLLTAVWPVKEPA